MYTEKRQQFNKGDMVMYRGSEYKILDIIYEKNEQSTAIMLVIKHPKYKMKVNSLYVLKV